MVLLNMTVLTVSSVKNGYTITNVLIHAQMVIMEMILQSVKIVMLLVKLVSGQVLINVPNVKKDTINNQAQAQEKLDLSSLMPLKNTQMSSNV